jgi:integrase
MIHHGTSDIILTIQASPVPLAALRDELLPQYDPPVASKSTRDKLAQLFRELEVLGVTSTDQFTPELVARYVASKAKCSPFTTRGLLMSMRTIFSYSEARRYTTVSAFRVKRLARYVRCPSSPPGRRHQSAGEIRAILAEMEGDAERLEGWPQWRARRIHALTSTIAYTGLRAREAQCLWACDLHLEERRIDLVPRGPRLPAAGDAPRFKTEASAQPIALPAALVPILETWMMHRHDHPDSWPMPSSDRIPWVFPGSKRVSAWTQGPPGLRPRERLQYYARRAGVEGVTFQSLRRSFCTIAEALGIPEALISRQARHSSIETTKRWYRRRELEALQTAFEGFAL